jgi:hypothetical protein
MLQEPYWDRALARYSHAASDSDSEFSSNWRDFLALGSQLQQERVLEPVAVDYPWCRFPDLERVKGMAGDLFEVVGHNTFIFGLNQVFCLERKAQAEACETALEQSRSS